jgi:hypothetical protein
VEVEWFDGTLLADFGKEEFFREDPADKESMRVRYVDIIY